MEDSDEDLDSLKSPPPEAVQIFGGGYRALEREIDFRDFSLFELGFCLLHNRKDLGDRLHVVLADVAARYPKVLFAHLHQEQLTFEGWKNDPKPVLVRFENGDIVARSSASTIMDMFNRASMNKLFFAALVREIEAECFKKKLTKSSSPPRL